MINICFTYEKHMENENENINVIANASKNENHIIKLIIRK